MLALSFFPFALDTEWICPHCSKPVTVAEGVGVWVDGRAQGLAHDDCQNPGPIINVRVDRTLL